MIFVFIMLAGILLGFFMEAFICEYKAKEVKPMILYVKMIVDVALVIALFVYCCTQNYYHVFSLILGLGIGIVPYLSNKPEEIKENEVEKNDQEG